MNIHGFKTFNNLPALYQPEADLLVISDIHLGLEASMTRDGNYVPKHQLEGLIQDIKDAKETVDASRILVNGDLKNEFKTRYTETNEINNFLEFLKKEFAEVILVKGNHDTFIDQTVEKHGLKLVDYHIERGILFVHGDQELSSFEINQKFETVVIGHEHPALALKDDVGVKEKIDCFLYGKNSDDLKLVVMPSFSTISRGTNINETPAHKLLSPILRERFDIKKLKAVGVSREAGLFKFPELGKL